MDVNLALLPSKMYRNMRLINRLSGTHILRPYDLTQHSYGVAVLWEELVRMENVPFTVDDFSLVLRHDVLETETADLPYHVKNYNEATQEAWSKLELIISTERFPYLESYNDEQLCSGSFTDPRLYQLFKLADMLELWYFVVEEFQLGNQTKNIKRVISKTEAFIQEKALTWGFPKVSRFFTSEVATYEC